MLALLKNYEIRQNSDPQKNFPTHTRVKITENPKIL